MDYKEKYEKLIKGMTMCGDYNGLHDDIQFLIDHIEKNTREPISGYKQTMPPDTIKWVTIKNMEMKYVWMLCVCMFGGYGTSPRCGWIEQQDEAIEFLKSILPRPDDYDPAEDPENMEG